jgi:hypothetical protein
MQSEHKTFHKLRKPLNVNFSLLALLQSETAKSFNFVRWPFLFVFTEQRTTSESLPAGKVTVGGGEEALWPRSSQNRPRLALTLVGGGLQPLDRSGRRWARACVWRSTVRLGRPVASGRRHRGGNAAWEGAGRGKLTWRREEDVAAVALSAWSGDHGDMREQYREQDRGREWRGQGRRSRARPRSFLSDEPGRGGGHAGQYEGHAAAAPPIVGHDVSLYSPDSRTKV